MAISNFDLYYQQKGEHWGKKIPLSSLPSLQSTISQNIPTIPKSVPILMTSIICWCGHLATSEEAAWLLLVSQNSATGLRKAVSETNSRLQGSIYNHCSLLLVSFFHFSNAQYQIKLTERGVLLGSTYITADLSQLLQNTTIKFPQQCFYTAHFISFNCKARKTPPNPVIF